MTHQTFITDVNHSFLLTQINLYVIQPLQCQKQRKSYQKFQV